MRRRLLILAAVAVVSLLIVGIVTYFVLRPGHPSVKYQPGDQDVAAGQIRECSFDTDKPGELPVGVEVFGGTWEVRAGTDSPSPPNVLCQTGTAAYPALCMRDGVYGDLDVAVRFKPISGRDDQAAGIIFRVQDADNYYILRANALEGNVNFYIYGGGRRSLLKGAAAKVASGQWQELKVSATGNHLRGYLNGELVVETTDDAYKAGKVGLWTKADSVTCFDDLRITAR